MNNYHLYHYMQINHIACQIKKPMFFTICVMIDRLLHTKLVNLNSLVAHEQKNDSHV